MSLSVLHSCRRVCRSAPYRKASRPLRSGASSTRKGRPAARDRAPSRTEIRRSGCAAARRFVRDRTGNSVESCAVAREIDTFARGLQSQPERQRSRKTDGLRDQAGDAGSACGVQDFRRRWARRVHGRRGIFSVISPVGAVVKLAVRRFPFSLTGAPRYDNHLLLPAQTVETATPSRSASSSTSSGASWPRLICSASTVAVERRPP